MGSHLQVVSPSSLANDQPFPFFQFEHQFAALGDSWFSIGTLVLPAGSNLVNEMVFDRTAAAVSFALPGDTLAHMVDLTGQSAFRAHLCGNLAMPFHAILLSAGGNDLIDAVSVPPTRDADDRSGGLLLTEPAWKPEAHGPARYLDETGWATFARYLRANFARLVALRDSPRSQSRGCPIFCHTYAVPTIRPAGAGASPHGWLYPSVTAHGIPPEDWDALAGLLLHRLSDLLLEIAATEPAYNLSVYDSCRDDALGLSPAAPGSTGISGDWVNEIHLTRHACGVVAGAWAPRVEARL